MPESCRTRVVDPIDLALSDGSHSILFFKIGLNPPGEPRHYSLWEWEPRDGKHSKILDSVFRASYAFTDTGVYFVAERDLDCLCYHLQFLDSETGQINTVVDFEDMGEGISVSPDGRSLVYTERSQTNSDIMLVENFR